MLPLDYCRCPGVECKAKQECARAVYPAKNERVTWAALYVRLDEQKNKCDMFVKLC